MNFRTTLVILLSTFLLQGCIAAAVVSTAAVATKTTVDPRTTGTQIDDTTLEVRVSNALGKDKELKEKTRIITTAYQGQILLSGQSPDPELSSRAQSIATGVEGTNEVYNEIRAAEPIGLATISNDTWITTKVRSQILTSNLVKSSNIKVITENSEVFLLGVVTEQEGDSAANIASHTNGVQKVTTMFNYVK